MGSEGRTHQTQIECGHCGGWFTVYFDDPEESFEGTCPNCNAHYPELYV